LSKFMTHYLALSDKENIPTVLEKFDLFEKVSKELQKGGNGKVVYPWT
jgi:hypothetical protein